MRVLLTYPSLQRRGGVQSFTRQLARELTSLGHEVRGFSGLHESNDETSFPELPEASSPDKFAPDIIHAQHHLPALAALLAFPDIPAVFHCHGGTWRDLPFRHPRIRHYLAMSHSLAERIKVESYLAEAEVSVHLNSVDSRRFRPRQTLPRVLDRVLVYHGRMTPNDPAVLAILEATTRKGIAVEFAGRGFGVVVDNPERELPDYPLVFASGISALEAMACGCAVIVMVPGACGPMIGSGNFDHLRAHNFSIAANSDSPTQEGVLKALDDYDSLDAARVAERVRHEADSVLSARQLVELYESVLDQHGRIQVDPRDESLAASAVLRGLTPMFHTAGLQIGRDVDIENGGGMP